MDRVVLAASVLFVASGVFAAEHKIQMAGSTYSPAVIEANVGDTLVFENDDTDAHNVFVPTVAFSTDLGRQEPGKPARLLLTRPGTLEIECVFHQEMIARVVVKP